MSEMSVLEENQVLKDILHFKKVYSRCHTNAVQKRQSDKNKTVAQSNKHLFKSITDDAFYDITNFKSVITPTDTQRTNPKIQNMELKDNSQVIAQNDSKFETRNS